MSRLMLCGVLSSLLLVGGQVLAQVTNGDTPAVCNFDATRQIAVEYQRASFDVKKRIFGKEIPYDRVWAPGGKPMTLFTNTPLSIDGTSLPAGAYTLFVIQDQKKWTLVVSKSSDTSGKYDEKDDLGRFPMEFGELSSAEPDFSVYFGHIAPDQCSMRIDLGRARAWVTIRESK